MILRRLVESVVPAHADRLVLDVGCGTGANLAALAVAYQCVGVDTSAEGIELARGAVSSDRVSPRLCAGALLPTC